MKAQHVLAAVAMGLFVVPIMLGLGSFFVIPLALLAIAMLPVAIAGAAALLIFSWHRTHGLPPDFPRAHRHPRLPMALATRP